MPIYRVDKTVYLDKISKCYKNIFIIQNANNDISLNNITNIMSRVKLSPFETFSSCCDKPSCLKVFINKTNGEILTEKNIDHEISEIIEKQYERAISLLATSKDKLIQLADRLLEKEVIFKDDLENILGKRPYLSKEEKIEEAKEGK